MMTEQRTQSCWLQRGASSASLERHKHFGCIRQRTFILQIELDKANGFGRQRQAPYSSALAANVQLLFTEEQILQLEPQHFARSQAIEQHQRHHGDITTFLKTVISPWWR